MKYRWKSLVKKVGADAITVLTLFGTVTLWAVATSDNRLMTGLWVALLALSLVVVGSLLARELHHIAPKGAVRAIIVDRQGHEKVVGDFPDPLHATLEVAATHPEVVDGLIVMYDDEGEMLYAG